MFCVVGVAEGERDACFDEGVRECGDGDCCGCRSGRDGAVVGELGHGEGDGVDVCESGKCAAEVDSCVGEEEVEEF